MLGELGPTEARHAYVIRTNHELGSDQSQRSPPSRPVSGADQLNKEYIVTKRI